MSAVQSRTCGGNEGIFAMQIGDISEALRIRSRQQDKEESANKS